ncbi:MAG TPA: hypothetical protein VN736_15695 [Candidatus Limnocylindrales bacterium]|nr:hypothetical protein [Candidatus Limnocylindrales bacterium]
MGESISQPEMIRLFDKLALALGLLAVLWGLARLNQGTESWLRPAGAPPAQVKILRFYASVGVLMTGEKAQLCYGVENAKTVHISPPFADVSPSSGRCLEVGPEHTTHYTILAEGFDGRVAMQSLTLPVENVPAGPRPVQMVAALLEEPAR